jgi:hypothetical protein
MVISFFEERYIMMYLSIYVIDYLKFNWNWKVRYRAPMPLTSEVGGELGS